jgi:hypothetical protein
LLLRALFNEQQLQGMELRLAPALLHLHGLELGLLLREFQKK